MESAIFPAGEGFPPPEELSYEQAFAELESIVSALETDQRSLEEILGLFERGQILARYCSGLLDKAELKVQQINGENLVDFEPEP
jgi:exodeoxyribonuclease VII small subunit